MQKFSPLDYLEVTPSAAITTQGHGWRAKCLQRLVRLELPVPKTVALPAQTVRAIAAGHPVDARAILAHFSASPLISVRPSPENPDWGGPGTILNVGMNAERHATLVQRHGPEAADALYLRFVQSYATHVARLDPDMFDEIKPGPEAMREALRQYEREMEEPFPEDPAQQLSEVLRSMARAWEGTSARLLRQAKGAPVEAALGLVVQCMAQGIGQGLSGSGVIQFVDPVTGLAQVTGRYLGNSQGRDALRRTEAMYLTRDPRGPSLEDLSPQVFGELSRHGAACRARLREEMQIEFTIEDGQLSVLDAVKVQRSARAGLKIAVSLALDGVISSDEAVLRVEPRALSELLHPQVDPRGQRDVFAKGIAASPGGAVGRLVFSSPAAQASAARGEPCILVRRETAPEDIRGMHSAVGVLTERGGVTSHAAVIARGLGLPCVVGASGLRLDSKDKKLTAADGRIFREGDLITLDGTTGEVLSGAAEMLAPALDDSFRTLLGWADKVRDIGIRANADTPADAAMARQFEAQGIGLCRTEHMFFDAGRISAVRQMILAEDEAGRRAALAKLLPEQRADFQAIFAVMAGLPVTIRLLDPPLHEFLPHSEADFSELSDAIGIGVDTLKRRAGELHEFNPMLGHRGCRLGITFPEIYEMQARAIFEAACAVAAESGEAPVPEVMIPLVATRKELAILKALVERTAEAVFAEQDRRIEYLVGTMIELPRAALMAGEIAEEAKFFSFGTNDLTQTTLGVSRDDAARFLTPYVEQGIYPRDPFVSLDIEGVGQLVELAAERGRQTRADLKLGICGEHGGDPASIAFCEKVGLDYVSASPYRVPIARLAAAQAALNASSR